MQKKSIFAIGAFALLVIGLVLTTGLATAYRGDYTTKGPQYNEERYQEMQTAIDTGDYQAWYSLMTEDGRHPRIVDVITTDNFAEFAKAHQAAENGDYETANTIRAQLGLNNGNGPRDGTGHGVGTKFSQNSQGQGRMQARNQANCIYN